MSSFALTGDDTLMINNYIFVNFATGDCVDVTFPNEVAAVKVGKNGNSLFALNESGKQADLVAKVIRGSADDQFLLALFAAQQNNFAATVLMIGSFIKKLGDGAGNVNSDTYILGGGIFSKAPEAKMNVEGDTEQSCTMWHLKFSQAVRVIS